MAILLSGSLLLVCALIHYETLRWANRFSTSSTRIQQQGKILVILLCSMGSHISHILLFGIVFFFTRDKLGLGTFGGTFTDNFQNFMYFSAETYTSVGYGDIYPTGSLRLISSVETLLGLMLISWSASYSYIEMQRHWSGTPSPAALYQPDETP